MFLIGRLEGCFGGPLVHRLTLWANNLIVHSLRAYAENVVEIHQDLTEIGRFIFICFNWVGMVMIGHDHLG